MLAYQWITLYFLGSYAKGNARVDSDIDVYVCSKELRKDDMAELGKLNFLK